MKTDNFKKTAQKVLSRKPDEARRLRDAGVTLQKLEQLSKPAPSLMESAPAGTISRSTAISVESIILEIGRPTLFVSGNDFELPADETLARRLRSARALIASRLASVGRVEVFDGAQKWPVGTAWMVADDVAITNRHVAEKFAERNASGKPQLLTDLRNRPYKVVVDFREEHGSSEESELSIQSVLYLPQGGGAVSDIALLKFAPGQTLPPPIPIMGEKAPIDSWIAVVGYPQPDDRIPPEAREVEESYFSNIYGVKRLSPGQIDDLKITGTPSWLMAHDATTLGGNSGSVLLDLSTGAAAGLHFRGEFKKANYAVDANEIRRVLAANGISFSHVRPAGTPAAPHLHIPGEEEAAEDLSQFKGYAVDFILPRGDDSFEIDLPEVTNAAPGKVAELIEGGTVLNYRNFSVVMNRARRLCYFSAVNINGKETFSIGGRRPPWKFDRRLDEALQIKDECYGLETAGKFSRGHMTRREDPNWGSRREDAVVSNKHTFYVTNACPQMQPFNAGMWLSLEDYALENADQDDMRISVYTGPIFRSNDPEFFGVKVPIDFWKIIAFRHDETKKLCATGYTMSQRDVLPSDEEFVFGQFRRRQVTIRHIETQTGLSFHQLRDHDPMDDGTESTAMQVLRTPSDIVFKRP